MKNSITLIAACVCLLLTTTASAQRFSASGRYGINTKGVSATVFLNQTSALEALYTVSHDKNRVLLTGMYQEHFNLGSNFTFFAGVGLHAGYKKLPLTEAQKAEMLVPVKDNNGGKPENRQWLSGADAIAGIYYRVGGSPVLIGVDIKPNVDFINRKSMLVDGGVRLGVIL